MLFSTLGLQGQGTQLTPWFVDSSASNHMTCCSTGLHDVCKYEGVQQHIQIVDRSTLSITAVGTLGSSFRDVFVLPSLSTNLICVGQFGG